MRITFSLVVAAMFLLLAACTKSTLIGEELLVNEKANIIFKDDLSLTMKSVIDDSILIFPINLDRFNESLVLGQLDDPIFGKSSSEIYTQLGLNLNRNGLPLIKAVNENNIDSIVMQLTLDTAGFYGESSATYDIEIRQILEPIDPDDPIRLYSDRQYMVDEGTVLSEISGIRPNPLDSVLTADSMLEVAHLRIPMSNDFLELITNNPSVTFDTVALSNQDSLNSIFNGLRIKVNSSNNATFGVNMLGISGIKVYYALDDTTNATYLFNFGIGAVKTEYIEHDYAGSLVEPFINQPDVNDSLLFIQSLAGINSIIGVEDLAGLGDIQINNAELELFAVKLPGDDAQLYPPIRQLISYRDNVDAERTYAQDVILALNENLLEVVFDGVISEPLEENLNVRKYNMKVTAQLQDILKGDTDNLIIGSFFKAFAADRVVLYGKNHPRYAPRLKLTYTKL